MSHPRLKDSDRRFRLGFDLGRTGRLFPTPAGRPGVTDGRKHRNVRDKDGDSDGKRNYRGRVHREGRETVKHVRPMSRRTLVGDPVRGRVLWS